VAEDVVEAMDVAVMMAAVAQAVAVAVAVVHNSRRHPLRALTNKAEHRTIEHRTRG
jgi:hypothetical protein